VCNTKSIKEFKIGDKQTMKILKIGDRIAISEKQWVDGEGTGYWTAQWRQAIVEEIILEPLEEDENYLSDSWKNPKSVNADADVFNPNYSSQLWHLAIKTKKGNYYSPHPRYKEVEFFSVEKLSELPEEKNFYE
jgi:hypothetical protein